MSHGEHPTPRPSLTSSPVTVDNPLPPGPQMTESTSEAIERSSEAIERWNETFKTFDPDPYPLPRSSYESRSNFHIPAWESPPPSTRKVTFEIPQSSYEIISGTEDGLSRSNSSAWQLAYGKSLEPAKEEDGGK